MNIYIKAYIYRLKEIALAVSLVCLSLIFCFVFWGKRVSCIDSQVSSYSESAYELFYQLNYEAELDNSFVYPDSDISVYKTDNNDRLRVSVLMQHDCIEYTLQEFSFANLLQAGEVAISRNVAETYEITEGSDLLLEASYNNEKIPVKVAYIVDVNYDFSNPDIDNDIGVIYVSWNEDYVNNTKCEYIVFANKSLSSELGNYTQILKSISYKSELYRKVVNKNLYVFVFEALLVMAGCFLAHISYYSKSYKMLYRCYLKGLSARALVFVPIIEVIITSIIPSLLIVSIFSLSTKAQSWFGICFFLFPIIIELLFVLVSLLTKNRKVQRS